MVMVTRRRDVRGELGAPLLVFAANVNTLDIGLSEPAD